MKAKQEIRAGEVVYFDAANNELTPFRRGILFRIKRWLGNKFNIDRWKSNEVPIGIMVNEPIGHVLTVTDESDNTVWVNVAWPGTLKEDDSPTA